MEHLAVDATGLDQACLDTRFGWPEANEHDDVVACFADLHKQIAVFVHYTQNPF